MKHFKKMISVMLVISLVATMMLSLASAATSDPSISVKSDDTHTYEVYQIFTATVSDDTLTAVKWGKNGTGTEGNDVDAAILTALEAIDASASDSTKLETITSYFSASSTAFGTVSKSSPLSVPTGYYLVKDINGEYTGKHDAYTAYVVKVVDKDIEISPKKVYPTVDLVVWDETPDKDKDTSDANWGETADHGINETYQYKITATLPSDVDYDTYDEYKLVFTETMGDSVIFESIESVKVGDTVINIKSESNPDGYTTTATEGCEGTWTLTIDDVKKIIEDKGGDLKDGTTVEIIFNAHLDEDADVTTSTPGTPIPNKVVLEYSNNPNDDTNLGKTPEDSVYVFTYELTATKVDAAKETVVLKGAKFTLSQNGTTIALYVKNGVYYVYDSDINSSETSTTEIVTGADGKFVVKGLDTGVYTLTETQAPIGYNLCDPVTVTISSSHGENEDGSSATATLSTDTKLSITVKDAKGSTLPTTGGIGTTILYIVGGVLVIGAGVALITKKRVDKEN